MQTPVRIWDKVGRRMIYSPEGGRVAIFLTMDGIPVQYKGNNHFAALPETVVMHLTSLYTTADSRRLYEGDVVDCEIPNEFGSVIPARGIVGWSKVQQGWTVYVVSPKMQQDFEYDVVNIKYLGNQYEHPELLNIPVLA